MPGGLFKKRRGSIWTAAADSAADEDKGIDLFADDEPEAEPAAQSAQSADEAAQDGMEAVPIMPDGSDTAADVLAGGAEGFEAEPKEGADPLHLFSAETKERERDVRKEKRIWALILTLFVSAFAVFAFISLRVGKIEVSGNEQLPSETIVKLSGIEYDSSMFFIRRHSHEQKLCEQPYIAEAEVELSFPNTVRITVKERREAAVIMGLGSVAIIDGDGYVLSIGQRASYEGLVKIYGAGAAGYQVNGHIGDMDDYASHALTALIAAIKESQVQDTIESVDLSNTLSVTMLIKSGVTVNLGTAEDLSVKLQRLALLAPELDKLGYKDGTLFIYTHGSPIYSPPSAPITAEELDNGDASSPEEDSEYTYVPSDRSGDTATPSPSPGFEKSTGDES